MRVQQSNHIQSQFYDENNKKPYQQTGISHVEWPSFVVISRIDVYYGKYISVNRKCIFEMLITTGLLLFELATAKKKSMLGK